MGSTTTAAQRASDAWFVTTHWSVVLSAREKESAEAGPALETLCRTYWYPLYAYVRRQGHKPHDAQDLTQEFFARLLEKDYLRAAEREKGRFRTFLIVALKRFLANEWDRIRAQKRGGGQAMLSVDTDSAEERYRIEAVEGVTADKVFERRWALTMLERAMKRLREEFEREKKLDQFESLKGVLTVERGGIAYGDIAKKTGMSEAAARVAVHRLRKRFREVFREEIANTVADPSDIDDEVRYLVGVLAE